METRALVAAIGSFVASAAFLTFASRWRVPLVLGRRLWKIKQAPDERHRRTIGRDGLWNLVKGHLLKTNREDPGEELELAVLSLLGSLRAGFSLIAALREAAQDARGVVGVELTAVVREYDAGVPLSDCLRRVGKNNGLGPDGPMLGAALEVLRVTGANATEALTNLAAAIRERRLLRGELRSKTADVHISATVLRWMPLALAGYIFSTRPELLGAAIESPVGKACLVYSVISWGLGVLLIRRLEEADIT